MCLSLCFYARDIESLARNGPYLYIYVMEIRIIQIRLYNSNAIITPVTIYAPRTVCVPCVCDMWICVLGQFKCTHNHNTHKMLSPWNNNFHLIELIIIMTKICERSSSCIVHNYSSNNKYAITTFLQTRKNPNSIRLRAKIKRQNLDYSFFFYHRIIFLILLRFSGSNTTTHTQFRTFLVLPGVSGVLRPPIFAIAACLCDWCVEHICSMRRIHNKLELDIWKERIFFYLSLSRTHSIYPIFVRVSCSIVNEISVCTSSILRTGAMWLKSILAF